MLKNERYIILLIMALGCIFYALGTTLMVLYLQSKR